MKREKTEWIKGSDGKGNDDVQVMDGDGISFMIKIGGVVGNMTDWMTLWVRLDGMQWYLMQSKGFVYNKQNAESELKHRAELAMKEFQDLGSVWTGEIVLKKGA